MLDYKALDKEIDVILKSFTKEDLNLWLKLKLERENLEKERFSANKYYRRMA